MSQPTSPAEAIIAHLQEDTANIFADLARGAQLPVRLSASETLLLSALQTAVGIQLARLWSVVDPGKDPAALTAWLVACHEQQTPPADAGR